MCRNDVDAVGQVLLYPTHTSNTYNNDQWGIAIFSDYILTGGKRAKLHTSYELPLLPIHVTE